MLIVQAFRKRLVDYSWCIVVILLLTSWGVMSFLVCQRIGFDDRGDVHQEIGVLVSSSLEPCSRQHNLLLPRRSRIAFHAPSQSGPHVSLAHEQRESTSTF